MDLKIERGNVGRIAERIVANELEYRGYRVSDLNKEGLSANADLIASNHKRTWQIQVKGASNKPEEKWWFQYGHCTDGIIRNGEPMFNRRQGFYVADMVVLVAVRSPRDYRCIVLPTKKAEQAAQLNIERYYRKPKKTGDKHLPGKVWIWLEPAPMEHKKDAESLESYRKERAIITAHDNWKIIS